MASEALIVVDVQKAFDDPRWGRRNNPGCEQNIRQLIDDFRERGEAVVFVRHDSSEPGSPLAPGHEGNAFQDDVVDGEPDLLVTKHVNSSFLGEPSLDTWLRDRDIDRIAICGIQTNMCCETTARMGGNLGYDVSFVIDATHTFDITGPDGTTFDADTVARMTAANLDGEFATVVKTVDYLKR
jgi:nicotinamidase-related amidase